MLSISRDSTLKIWQLSTGALLRTLTSHGYALMSVAIHQAEGDDATVLFFGDEQGHVFCQRGSMLAAS